MKAKLRVLQTTDLHMHLLPYDYFADRRKDGIGLIGLADEITALKTEADVTTLYFDTGDLLEGNQLADEIAAADLSVAPHPMIAALNMLQCDAITLGNHDFDYGIPFLRKVLSEASFPVVLANIQAEQGSPLAERYTILEHELVTDTRGSAHINVGVLGLGPTLVNRSVGGNMKVDDALQTAHSLVPEMKAAGADIIIALCHFGLGEVEHSEMMENAAIPLANVEGIDVLLTGHTHDIFPNNSDQKINAVIPHQGKVHGKPVVMAGHHGRSLGVVELNLERAGKSWNIVASHSIIRTPSSQRKSLSPIQEKLTELVARPHLATCRKMNTLIAVTESHIHSYFATVRPDNSQQLLAKASLNWARETLRDTSHANIPLLAVTSSYQAGGHRGFDHDIEIPIGPIARRDIAAIYPFEDKLCVILQTGAEIQSWLERAASHYNQLHIGRSDQWLFNPKSAGYNCDCIHGLEYQIDLTQPPRFDHQGRIINPETRRIVSVTRQQKKVEDDEVFVVATNSFRASGGGGFQKISQEKMLGTSETSLREILTKHVETSPIVKLTSTVNWRFYPLPNTSALFYGRPNAKEHMIEDIEYVRNEESGLAVFRINL